MIPALRALGIGLIPWSPVGQGLLTGILAKHDEGRRSSDKLTQQLEQVRPQVEQYEALCREIGAEPQHVALAWLLHNPVVTAAITGPRTLDQLRDNIAALDVTLSEETLKRLDEIWPGPGGEAPMAYAW